MADYPNLLSLKKHLGKSFLKDNGLTRHPDLPGVQLQRKDLIKPRDVHRVKPQPATPWMGTAE